MKLLKCLLIKNGCWARFHGTALTPVGIVVHSTDPAGRVLKRFVQPAAGQTEGLEINGKPVCETEMLAALGKNQNNNHWNRIQDSDKAACVHGFLGELADGTLAAVQTLEWTMPCWGAAFGSKGSYDGRDKNRNPKDPLYIHFEMIEDPEGATDPTYCNKITALAVEFCVHLMRLFPSIKLENVVSHKEAHARGYATDHGDPESWWKRRKTGMSMEKFRDLIVEEQAKPDPDAPKAEHHPFEDVPDGKFYSADVQAAWEIGIVKGIDETHFKPDEPCTRAQATTMIMRAVGYVLGVLDKGSGP